MITVEQRRTNNASMAVQWQQLCEDSYSLARTAYSFDHFNMAAFYQRQAARDYVIMKEYLHWAIR